MHRKLLLLTLSVLFAMPVCAQDAVVLPKPESRWKIGISASADYGYRTLKTDDDRQTIATIIDGRNEREIAKLGYSGGLNLRYQISKRLRVGAGVHYANRGYKEKTADMYEADFSGGYIFIGTRYLVHSYRYVEVPITIDYSFYRKRKINLYVGLGIKPGVLLSAVTTSHTKYNDGTKKVDENKDNMTLFNKINLSPTVAISAEYKLTSRSTISIAPTFRYGILKLVDAPIHEYLWSGGVNVGYYRSL